MLRARSMLNRGAVLDSEECGCFFCLHMFKPGDVENWGEDGQTARCPYCGVDSVLPQSTDYDLDDKLLLRMKEYWF